VRASPTFRLRLLGAAAATLLAASVAASAPAQALTSTGTTSGNLIHNPGAEAGAGGSGEVVAIPGWTRAYQGTNVTVVRYGSGFLSSTDPGPAHRGNNFFAGGPGAYTERYLTQRVDLTPYAASIDRGGVGLTMSGWFGGSGSKDDCVEMLVRVTNGFYRLGPVHAGDRNGKPALLFRSALGGLARGDRYLDVQLIFGQAYPQDSYDNAYADNLNLHLTNL